MTTASAWHFARRSGFRRTISGANEVGSTADKEVGTTVPRRSPSLSERSRTCLATDTARIGRMVYPLRKSLRSSSGTAQTEVGPFVRGGRTAPFLVGWENSDERSRKVDGALRSPGQRTSPAKLMELTNESSAHYSPRAAWNLTTWPACRVPIDIALPWPHHWDRWRTSDTPVVEQLQPHGHLSPYRFEPAKSVPGDRH